MDFYRTEYEEYWSRPDRWGTNSFTNVEQILVPLLACCGPGRILDVGCGMGRLVKSLLRRGVDAHGLDVSERVIAAHRRTWPDRFHRGSALSLPFESSSFDTVVSSDCLEHIAPDDLPRVVSELARVSKRYVFLTVSTALDRDHRWHLTVRPRAWWEALFFEAGFRRNPRMLAAVPFVALEDEPWQIPLVFELDPAGKEDFDDWGKRSDRESDGCLAFYDLAGKFVRDGQHVVDWACATGFGSAVLAARVPEARVTGVGEAAGISYARRHYAPCYSNLRFCAHEEGAAGGNDQPADVAVLRAAPEACRGPEAPWDAMARAAERLRPGGTLVVQIPAGSGAVSDAGTATVAWGLDAHDHICPPVPALGIRHLYAVSWSQQREQREVKLPLHGAEPDADAWVAVYQREDTRLAVPVAGPRRDKVVVLAHHRSGDHYAELLDRCPFPVEFVQRFGVEWTPPVDAGLVVSLEVYDEPGVSALRRSVEAGVPTLVLADGILEYRNTWEHPQNTPGALMQPVVGHKVACIGPSQARILESWGNYGKCEVVGAPRFDRYLRARRQPRSGGACRVLVATARTPYFTPDQREHVLRGLRDLRASFAEDAASGSPRYSVSWRIARELADELGLGEADRRAHHDDVAEALSEADALVTTPSTLMVEGMLSGLPVAVLDYGNAPAYYSVAWRITAPVHIGAVLDRLRAPSAAEWLFQEHALRELCACTTPATPRLIELMAGMIECGRTARECDAPLSFPVRMLATEPAAAALPDNAFDMPHLYPDHAHFKRNQVAALHYEVALLRQVVGSRESDLNRFDKALRRSDAELARRAAELERRAAELDGREQSVAEWWGFDAGNRLNVQGLLGAFVEARARERRVFCWGAGEMGRRLVAILGDAASSIEAFIDSNPCRTGLVGGWPVSSPSRLWEDEKAPRPFVLIATMYATSIESELREHGFAPGIDYACVPPLTGTETAASACVSAAVGGDPTAEE